MSPCRLTGTCLPAAIAAGVKTSAARVVILAALLVGWPGHVHQSGLDRCIARKNRLFTL